MRLKEPHEGQDPVFINTVDGFYVFMVLSLYMGHWERALMVTHQSSYAAYAAKEVKSGRRLKF